MSPNAPNGHWNQGRIFRCTSCGERADCVYAYGLCANCRDKAPASSARSIDEPVHSKEEIAELLTAVHDLSMALGNPAMEASGDQTIESQLIRHAAQRIREENDARNAANSATSPTNDGAAIEKCEKYLHDQRCGSVCGLRKLARSEGAAK